MSGSLCFQFSSFILHDQLTFAFILIFSFIENFGTHIITSVTIGGRDEVYIKQHISSPLSSADIEKYVQDIGDRRFLTLKSHFTSSPIATKGKVSVLEVIVFFLVHCFNIWFICHQPSNWSIFICTVRSSISAAWHELSAIFCSVFKWKRGKCFQYPFPITQSYSSLC